MLGVRWGCRRPADWQQLEQRVALSRLPPCASVALSSSWELAAAAAGTTVPGVQAPSSVLAPHQLLDFFSGSFGAGAGGGTLLVPRFWMRKQALRGWLEHSPSIPRVKDF